MPNNDDDGAKVGVKRNKWGKMCSCMWSLTASIFLDIERSCLLGKVLLIEHSWHSYERIYEYCSQK